MFKNQISDSFVCHLTCARIFLSKLIVFEKYIGFGFKFIKYKDISENFVAWHFQSEIIKLVL